MPAVAAILTLYLALGTRHAARYRRDLAGTGEPLSWPEFVFVTVTWPVFM